MKKVMTPFGIGMAIGAALMGTYTYVLPKKKKIQMKKAFKDFIDEHPSVKIK